MLESVDAGEYDHADERNCKGTHNMKAALSELV